MNARELTKALGGQWHGTSGTARCPSHDDKRPSLSIGESGARLLVHCHSRCDQADVIAALRKLGLWTREQNASRQQRPGRTRRDDDAARSAAARVIWRAARPIVDTPAEEYLRERGLRPGTDGWPPTLRYHHGLKHRPSGSIYSALIAAVAWWPAAKVVAIQRVFLKAGPGDHVVALKPKMSLGPIRGGAVRLAPAAETLVLTEGVETGLAVLQATQFSTWATVGTANLKTVLLPPFVCELIIAADGDDAGRAAAKAAGARWARAGYRVRVAIPSDGQDWNDVLIRRTP